MDVENNLIYRVSGIGVYTPRGPVGLKQANTIRNNIVAFARTAITTVNDPYKNPAFTTIPQSFVYSNNLFYFDRAIDSNPKFLPDGGCVYSGGSPFTQFQLWKSNLYWRTDGGFASDAKAFGVQTSAGTGGQAPCGNLNDYTFYTFAMWQQVEKTCKAWCRIRAIIRRTRRTIIPCRMAPRAWGSSCSTPARPDGPTRRSSLQPSPQPSRSNCSIPRRTIEHASLPQSRYPTNSNRIVRSNGVYPVMYTLTPGSLVSAPRSCVCRWGAAPGPKRSSTPPIR